MRIKIYPSLLAADSGYLADGALRAEAAGGDALHLDIMDGHFVPNLSMGPEVVAMADRTVKMPLNVHLMMTNPDQYVPVFIDAGSDTILIHIEAACDVPATLRRIRELGAQTGITLNPGTPPELLFPVLRMVDQVLCMTVYPGHGGQPFDAGVLPKIRVLRDRAESEGMQDLDILVDGGITVDTARQCAAHGANCFVAGTFLYRGKDMAALVTQMRSEAAAALKI